MSFLLNRVIVQLRILPGRFNMRSYTSRLERKSTYNKNDRNFNLSLLIAPENRKEREIHMADQSRTIYRSVR